MNECTCPFPGLLPFQEKDAPFFFGRDTETIELLKRLQQGRFLAVIGVSGSGKSSLVHAGVKPELRFSTPPCRIVEMKPGNGPVRELENALGTQLEGHSFGLADSFRGSPQRALIIVDQFEEIFPYRKGGNDQAKEADLFVQQLLRASSEPGLPVHVLLTMRTDYLGHCALFRGLPEVLNQGTYLVPRLTRHEQEEAIRSPLKVSGVAIDREVVEGLLNAAEANRDELPVLQHLLKRLWEEWSARGGVAAITQADLFQTGGWESAVARDAGGILNSLPASERDAAKRVFQRITEKGTGERPIRTPCSFGNLVALTQTLVTVERLGDLLENFRKRDLLLWECPLANGSRIDIPHECITWRWSDLADWIEEEDRDRKRLEFIDQSRRSGVPLAGSALDEALVLQSRITDAWVGRYGLDASLLKGHIGNSRKRADRLRERTAWTIVALGVLFVAALGGLGIAGVQWNKSRNESSKTESANRDLRHKQDELNDALEKATALAVEADKAKTKAEIAATQAEDLATASSVRSIAATALSTADEDPELALLLATEAAKIRVEGRVVPEAEAALRQILGPLRLVTFPDIRSRASTSAAFSPDQKTIAFAGNRGEVTLVDVETGNVESAIDLGLPQNNDAKISFTNDGKHVFVTGSNRVVQVDLRTREPIAYFYAPRGTIRDLAVSPDNATLAVVSTGGNSGGLILWNVASRTSLPLKTLIFDAQRIRFLNSTKLLVISSGGIDTLDLKTGTTGNRVRQTSIELRDASADGTIQVFLSENRAAKRVTLLNDSSQSVLTLSAEPEWVKLSPDGGKLLYGVRVEYPWDQKFHLVDLASKRESELTTAASAIFSEDSRFVLTVGGPLNPIGTMWNSSDGSVAKRFPGASGNIDSATFYGDGAELAVHVNAGSNASSAIWLLDASGESARANRAPIPGDLIVDCCVGSDLLGFKAVTDATSIYRIDPTNPAAAPALLNSSLPPRSAEVAYNRRFTRYSSSSIRVGKSEPGFRIVDPVHGKTVVDTVPVAANFRLNALSMDTLGHRLAVAGSSESFIFEVDTRRKIPLRGKVGIYPFVLSPDGRLLATGNGQTIITLWDALTGATILSINNSNSHIGRAEFNKTASRLAVGLDNNSIKLFDTERREKGGDLLGTVSVFGTASLFDSPGSPTPHFSPDGRFLLMKQSDHLPIYSMDVDEMLKSARSRVNRTLTKDECKQYLHMETCRARQ